MATYDPADPVDAHVLMPEYLTCEDKSDEVAAHVIEWLTKPAKRQRLIAQMAALKERVGHGGASRRAAEYMLTGWMPASSGRCGRTISSPSQRHRRGARSGLIGPISDCGLRIAD